MKWRILDTGDADAWDQALAALPQQDIYFSAAYHRAYEVIGDGTAYAFVAEDDDQLLFYPFLVRPINRVGSNILSRPYYDIETVYGYSGPLATSSDPTFLTHAWACFRDWCHSQYIIAEFVRFHPLFGNHQFAEPFYRLSLDRKTIVVPLDRTAEELHASYSSEHRNMVRKALKKGLTCNEVSFEEGIEQFKQLYTLTMSRVSARDYYYFPDNYYDSLRDLGSAVKLFRVSYQDHIICAAIFLLYNDHIHYHLAGSDSSYRYAAPNNLLLYTVADWGHEHGFRQLHLGGGRTPSPDDSLFRFKESISTISAPFYIGMHVHDQAKYDELCMTWMEQYGGMSRPPYFLLYRLEKP